MKTTICFSICLSLLLLPCMSPAQTPMQIGGFVLDRPVSEYKDRIKMETALPIRYAEYLTEVEIKKMKGYKSGLISYGNCAVPGDILRVKLKYADSSKQFYQALLKRFKNRFGEPSEWRGDPFHVMIAWKWSFTDNNNNRISMILQHNTKDEEEKIGNAVKITLLNRIEQERRCFEAKYPEFRESPSSNETEVKIRESADWNQFIPQ